MKKSPFCNGFAFADQGDGSGCAKNADRGADPHFAVREDAAKVQRPATDAKVGIIGAGFAGLSTAKVLRAFGFEVTVFEKEPDVGGVWAASRRYPGLTTQNPRTTYALSDFPMPASYPEWPSGQQVQAYLQSYAEHFGLVPFLRMSTTGLTAQAQGAASAWVGAGRDCA